MMTEESAGHDEGSSLPPPPPPPLPPPSPPPPAVELPPIPPRRGRKRGLAVVLVLAAVAAGVVWFAKRESKSEAEKVCDRLNRDGVTVAEGSGIIVDAVNADVSISDIQSRCGSIVDAVTNGLGFGPLKDNVDVVLGTCAPDSIDGTVVNNNDSAVDVTLRYELLEADGTTRVNDGIVFVDSVNPGQTVKWDDFLLDASYEKCRVEIDSVRSTD